MYPRFTILSDLLGRSPEHLTQLIAKLELFDYMFLGTIFCLVLFMTSLFLLVCFYRAKTRVRREAWVDIRPLSRDALQAHQTLLSHYRPVLEALQNERRTEENTTLPNQFDTVSKGVLSRSYRRAYMLLLQLALCAEYLQALTSLLVIYTDQRRMQPTHAGPDPATVLRTLCQLEQVLQEPVAALRHMDEPVVWRTDEDIPSSIKGFDAEAFWHKAIQTTEMLWRHVQIDLPEQVREAGRPFSPSDYAPHPATPA